MKHRPDRQSAGRRARTSVRGRLTLATAAASGLVLMVATLGVLAVVRLALLSSLDDAAAASAAQVVALAGERPLPDPLPVTGAAVVQVVDVDGAVIASSAGGDRLAPLLPPGDVARARGGDPVVVNGSRLGSASRYRVVGAPVGVGSGAASGGTVLVATSMVDVDRSGAVLQRVALVGVPLAVAAVAALAWRTAGSALAPVEALRASAAALVAGPAPGRPAGPGRGRSAGRPARDRSSSDGPPPTDGPLPVPASGDEVARLAVTLNDALGRVTAAGDRQRAFVADAAHELRSPLGSLRTQLEVALVHPGAQPWREVAAGCLVDVERTAALVDDLLVLARLDEAPADGGSRTTTDLAALVRAVVDDGAWRVPVRVVGPGATGAPSGAVAGADRRAVAAVADERAVRRAVRNLVANAARHAASAVVVTVGQEGAAAVVVEVADDGPGIPEGDRGRVFERFTRLDDARDRDAGGAGLGLSIVRAAVEREGGTVAALATPGGGALLRVVLPAAP